MLFPHRKLKYLVTGTGRSGTVFMARLLTSVGIPCGHESIFDWRGWQGAINKIYYKHGVGLSQVAVTNRKDGKHEHIPTWLPNLDKIQADSSYMAAPYLANELLSKTKFVHVVRNPINVVNSFCNSFGYFRHNRPINNPWEDFIFSWLPDLAEKMSTMERGILFWCKWNKIIEQNLIGRTKLFYRIEDKPTEVLKFIGKASVDPNSIFNDTRINTRNMPGIRFTIEDLPEGQIRTELLEMCQRYGYDLLQTDHEWAGSGT